MEKPKKYTIWTGAQALFPDWDHPPQQGQSVLLAFDHPTKPRLIDYTLLMNERETPATKGYVSKGVIAADSFKVIYTPAGGFENPTDAVLNSIPLPIGVLGEMAQQQYRRSARQILNRYQRIIAHGMAAAAQQVPPLGQDAKRQEVLKAALAAFLAQENEKQTPAQSTSEPATGTPATPDADKTKPYADLTLPEKHKLLVAEEKATKQALEALGKIVPRSLSADERVKHFESIQENRAYQGTVLKELRKVTHLMGRAPESGDGESRRPGPRWRRPTFRPGGR